MKSKYVYVAGPIFTSGRVTHNVREAVIIAAQIMEDTNGTLVPFVPHLYVLWDIVTPEEPEFWLTLDKAWLMKCDALLRLPGDSVGADMEIQWCVENGIPFFTNYVDLMSWHSEQT